MSRVSCVVKLYASFSLRIYILNGSKESTGSLFIIFNFKIRFWRSLRSSRSVQREKDCKTIKAREEEFAFL